MTLNDSSHKIWRQIDRLHFAFLHPLWVLSDKVAQWILPQYEKGQLEFINVLTGCHHEDILRTLSSAKATAVGQLTSCGHRTGGTLSLEEAFILFGLIRLTKPAIVVETGISQGMSSMVILQGLALNNHGELYSIDLPPETKGSGSYLPGGQQLGFLVPEELRQRWHVILGDAREVLPLLLAKQAPIDMFLHDSLHTPRHMKFEYETAWPSLKQDGILLSHDISMPWLRFCHRFGRPPYHYSRLGGAVK